MLLFHSQSTLSIRRGQQLIKGERLQMSASRGGRGRARQSGLAGIGISGEAAVQTLPPDQTLIDHDLGFRPGVLQ